MYKNVDVSVNAHSSINIVAQYSVRFDPYSISGNLRDADVIFITHPHYDHFSENDIRKVVKDGTVFIAPETMRTEMYRVATNVVFMKPGMETDVMGMHIKAVSAYNKTKEFHPKSNGWLGYVVTIENKRFYIAGDLDKCDEAEEGFCDVAFVPIGGNYTFDYKQAAKFIEKIKPKYVVPTHYGLLTGDKTDGEKFAELVKPFCSCELKIK